MTPEGSVLAVLVLLAWLTLLAAIGRTIGRMLAQAQANTTEMPPEQCAPDYGRLLATLAAEGDALLERERSKG